MLVKALLAAVLAAAAVVIAGCHHDRYNIKYKTKEECPLPPHEPRFDDPETATWRRPIPKKENSKPMMGSGPSRMMGGAGGLNPGGF